MTQHCSNNYAVSAVLREKNKLKEIHFQPNKLQNDKTESFHFGPRGTLKHMPGIDVEK